MNRVKPLTRIHSARVLIQLYNLFQVCPESASVRGSWTAFTSNEHNLILKSQLFH
jgi:hypothetical protein